MQWPSLCKPSDSACEVVESGAPAPLPTAHHRLDDDDQAVSSRWLLTPRPWTLLHEALCRGEVRVVDNLADSFEDLARFVVENGSTSA
jgi:hypothetical protein